LTESRIKQYDMGGWSVEWWRAVTEAERIQYCNCFK
jgi:hypothetical protein